VRALAFNGAEVVYRPSEAVPMTQVGLEPGGTWLLQNRAHAHFNNVYMICPNVGPVYVHPRMEHPYDIAGGNSHIVDYQGNVLGHTASGANTFVAGIVDIEALRQFRTMNLNSNWMKDLRTEIFRRMYDEPIHPKNLWLQDEPLGHAEIDDVYRSNIERLIARGSFTRPAREFPGARFLPPSDDAAETDWQALRRLWSSDTTDS
jgi:beta-ureidopropionase